MRFNQNTLPSLYALDNLDWFRLPMDEAFMMPQYMPNASIDKKTEMIADLAKGAKSIRKQSVKNYFLTQPFIKAIEKALPKIVDNQLHIKNNKPDCGTLMFNDGFCLYLINPQDKGAKCIIYGFNRSALTSYCFVDNNMNYTGYYPKKDKDGAIFNDLQGLDDWITSILTAVYFIHNCEIDTVQLKPNAKHRDKGVKFFNEMKSDVLILDCNWFTELIRDIPFKVEGHLRWQPVGEGRSKRKLIWIADYEKKGYHKKAKKESYETTQI